MASSRRFLMRGLAAGGALIGIGLCGLPSGELRQGTPSPDSVNSVGFVELKSVLLELRRTWNPQGKARVLSRAQPWKEVFEAPLLWILQRPRHDLLNEAIFLAGALGMEEAHERTIQYAARGPAATRAVAVVAAEHLQPWSPEDLDEFLADSSPEVQVAALAVMATRDDRPMEHILTALGSEHEDVRNAALAAIPSVMAEEDLGVLIAMAGEGTDEDAGVLRAFKAMKVTAEVEAFLFGKLQSSELTVKATALEALAKKGSQLSNPGLVWNMVLDADLPLDLRATAFRCLEKTRSYDLAKLRTQPAFTEPLLTYFAARCRIASGDREGAGLLLELLNSGGPSEEEGRVLAAAGRLLGQVSGTSSGAGIEAWSHWFWYGGPLKTHQLPDPPFGW